MKAWLRGDLRGVSPREELVALRTFAVESADAGEDLTRFFKAFAELDAVALAELCAGPRAVGRPEFVRASLAVAEELERVMSPSGLYNRLAILQPECGRDILAMAVARHPAASWITALSRRAEAVPGRILLGFTRGTPHYDSACKRCAEAGFVEALTETVQAQPDLQPLVAAVRALGAYPALPIAAATVAADSDLLVVEAVAAIVGPNVDAWAIALFAKTPEYRAFAKRYSHVLGED
jgi:hypothetical protein